MSRTQSFSALFKAQAYVAQVHAEHGPRLARKEGELVRWCRETLRRDYPLARPTLQGRLERRQALAQLISTVAVDGRVGIVHGGRDCDGVEAYQGDVIPATTIAVERHLDIFDNSFEGPWGWHLCTPADAQEHGYRLVRNGWEG
jgi:hypothetical protein